MDTVFKLVLAASSAAAAIAATPTSAATFIVDTTTNQPLAPATYATFNGRTLGSSTQTDAAGITVSFTGGGGFVQGSLGNVYLAPVVSGGNGAKFGGQADGSDTTTYVSTGVGSATLTFSNPTSYIGFLLGSIDSYNSLTLYTADGTIQTFSGSQFGALTSSRYVNISSNSFLIKAVFASTANAMEFDNVAVASVPEPASWALMLVGFGAVGFGMRRYRKLDKRISYAV